MTPGLCHFPGLSLPLTVNSLPWDKKQKVGCEAEKNKIKSKQGGVWAFNILERSGQAKNFLMAWAEPFDCCSPPGRWWPVQKDLAMSKNHSVNNYHHHHHYASVSTGAAGKAGTGQGCSLDFLLYLRLKHSSWGHVGRREESANTPQDAPLPLREAENGCGTLPPQGMPLLSTWHATMRYLRHETAAFTLHSRICAPGGSI